MSNPDARDYDRMQDMVRSYTQLAIKTFSVVSGGGLISVSAAYITLLTAAKQSEKKILLATKQTLANSFEDFTFSMVLILTGLVVVYFGRLSFLHAARPDLTLQEARKFEICGWALENIALVIYFSVFILLSKALFTLSYGFLNLANL